MNASLNNFRQSGFSMIEVLVTLIILLVGLLGLAGLMVQSQRSEMESYQRVQALILLQDMAGRISANRMAASCYNFTNATSGTPYLGTTATYAPVCNAAKIINYYNLSQNSPYSALTAPTTAAATSPAATAVSDMSAWSTLLQGAAETSGGSSAGAMIGARGCISYDSSTELPELDPATGLQTGKKLLGTGIYTLSVAWQGMGDTFANTSLLCGKGLYLKSGTADEALRRVASLTFRLAALTK
jgi:type IV pilus assembly protein PilV